MPIMEDCTEEDRSKCSQREWAALEKLKASDAAYTVGMVSIDIFVMIPLFRSERETIRNLHHHRNTTPHRRNDPGRPC